MFDPFKTITDFLISTIEESGQVPWKRGWKPFGCEAPMNLVTKKFYKGMNSLFLDYVRHIWGYSTGYWATFNQIKKAGGSVKRDSKSTIVWLWKVFEKGKKGAVENIDEVDKKERIWKCWVYHVFNYDQTDGMKLPKFKTFETQTVPEVEKFISDYHELPSLPLKATTMTYPNYKNLLRQVEISVSPLYLFFPF